MYHAHGVIPAAAAAGGTLAFTGVNTVYDACAAFAVIALGFAIKRIAPKKS